MAINPDNYANLSFDEISGIQRVYIGDYKGTCEALQEAAERHNSGKHNTAKSRAEVEDLVRIKLSILEDINSLGRILDARDGTVRTDG